jgi:hypothetical protein
MRAIPHLTALAVALTLLPACSKQGAPAAKDSAATSAAHQAAAPFQRNGELLSVNVDNMPRQAFIAKMAELTGVKITAEGDNNQTISVHVTDGTLRKVLSQAIADAPYSVSMQYTNLQDSFPAIVSITRYHTAAQNTTALLPAAAQGNGVQRTAIPAAQQAAAAQDDGDEPDISAMSPDEQMKYFLSQSKEDQVSIIFNMEPTKSDIALMNKLITKDNIDSEVKTEILDSLSSAEYEDGAATIKLALESKDPEVATKAAEVLSELGSEADIPVLKKLAETTDNEDVRTAANDAIETLSP